MWERKIDTGFGWGNLKGRDNVDDVAVDGSAGTRCV